MATVAESLGTLVEEADDEMVTLACEQLLAAHVADQVETKREGLVGLGVWANDIARSALAS